MLTYNQRTAALRCAARAVISRSVSRYDELPSMCRAIGAYDVAKFFDAMIDIATTDYVRHEVIDWPHWDALSVPYPALGQEMAHRLYFNGALDMEYFLGLMKEMAKAFGAFGLDDFSKRFRAAIWERRGGEDEDYTRLRHDLMPQKHGEIRNALEWHCESPLEVKVARCLAELKGYRLVSLPMRWRHDPPPCDQKLLSLQHWLRIPQSRKEIRIDMLVALGGKWRIAIECDGHDYHERTQEQAIRDRSRDRIVQAMGYRILRFTGREIHRSMRRCADEIDELLTELASADLKWLG